MALPNGSSFVLNDRGLDARSNSGCLLSKLASGAATGVHNLTCGSMQFLVRNACGKHPCAQKQLDATEAEVSNVGSRG